MKFKPLFLIAGSLLAGTLLQACGGSSSHNNMTSASSSSSAPTGNQPVTLDTTQVQALSQATSETDDPIAVNDGLVTVAGSSDSSSDPATVTSP